MKKCKGCGEEKSLDDFGNDKKGADEKTSKCKTCRNNNTQKYKEEHKEKISEYNKKYNQENKELKAELNKKNYKNKKVIVIDDTEPEEEEEEVEEVEEVEEIK